MKCRFGFPPNAELIRSIAFCIKHAPIQTNRHLSESIRQRDFISECVKPYQHPEPVIVAGPEYVNLDEPADLHSKRIDNFITCHWSSPLKESDESSRLGPLSPDVGELEIVDRAEVWMIPRERQQEERQAAGTDWTDNGLVFTIPKGRPLDPTNLTRRFRRLPHKAELRTIRFHDLRHSTATLLLEQGGDLVVIKELLGHAHIGVTAGVYAHVRLRLQRQAIDSLSNALSSTGDALDDPPAAAAVR